MCKDISGIGNVDGNITMREKNRKTVITSWFRANIEYSTSFVDTDKENNKHKLNSIMGHPVL